MRRERKMKLGQKQGSWSAKQHVLQKGSVRRNGRLREGSDTKEEGERRPRNHESGVVVGVEIEFDQDTATKEYLLFEMIVLTNVDLAADQGKDGHCQKPLRQPSQLTKKHLRKLRWSYF